MHVADAYNDPYDKRRNAGINRKRFEKSKRHEKFKRWRNKQRLIQQDKCAYCQIDLKKNNIVVHIDHIQPLYHEGNNDFENLVLTCRRCNLRKSTSNKYVKPSWIRKREKNVNVAIARRRQKKQIKDLIQQELDEQVGFTLKNMF